MVALLEDGNLVDQAWGPTRPSAPAAPLRVHPAEWAGETVASKLERMRVHMRNLKADALLATSLDEVR